MRQLAGISCSSATTSFQGRRKAEDWKCRRRCRLHCRALPRLGDTTATPLAPPHPAAYHRRQRSSNLTQINTCRDDAREVLLGEVKSFSNPIGVAANPCLHTCGLCTHHCQICRRQHQAVNTAQTQHNTHSLVNKHPPSPLPTASYLDRTVYRSREQPPSGDGQADNAALVSREGLHAAHVLDVPDLHAMGEGCTGKGTTQQTLLTSASLVTEQKTQVSTIQMLFHSQCQHTHTTCTQTHMGM